MDPRHESYKECLLNHLITSINTYIKNNTDTLVTDTQLQKKIIAICTHIYQYLGVYVDTNHIVDKKNLLSIDVVLFPTITDPEAEKILTSLDFEKLIEEIKLISIQHNKNIATHQLFTQTILSVLNESASQI